MNGCKLKTTYVSTSFISGKNFVLSWQTLEAIVPGMMLLEREFGTEGPKGQNEDLGWLPEEIDVSYFKSQPSPRPLNLEP